jgi:hypothetical protein
MLSLLEHRLRGEKVSVKVARLRIGQHDGAHYIVWLYGVFGTEQVPVLCK